jgi:O-antigen/teichoic acid export membrane protein
LLNRLPGPRSPGWLLAESVAAAVFSLLSMLAIGRVIGPHDTGIGTIAIAAFLFVEMFGAVLFPDALVQLPSLARRHSESAITAAVLVGAVAGCGLATAAPLLAAGADAPEVVWLVLALAPLAPVAAFSGAVSGLLLREQRFRLLSLRLLLGQPLALCIGLVLALGGHGPWAMIGSQVAATVVTFLLMAGGARSYGVRPRLDLGALRELRPVALPQMAGLAINLGRYRIFLLALGLAMPQALLAMSHFAFRLLDAALGMVWQSAGRLAMPRLCALQHDREAMAEAYGDIAQLQALLGLPICAGIALVAPDMVAVLLGPAWAGTAGAAGVVGIAAMALVVIGDQSSLFVAVGKARRNFQMAVALLLVPLAALAVLRPETPMEAALAWSVQCAIVPPVLGAIVLRELRRPPGWLARRVAPAVVATAAMALVVLALQSATATAPALGRLLASASIGGAVYLGVAWAALGWRLPRALRTMAPARPGVVRRANPSPTPTARSTSVVRSRWSRGRASASRFPNSG